MKPLVLLTMILALLLSCEKQPTRINQIQFDVFDPCFQSKEFIKKLQEEVNYCPGPEGKTLKVFLSFYEAERLELIGSSQNYTWAPKPGEIRSELDTNTSKEIIIVISADEKFAQDHKAIIEKIKAYL